MSTWSKDELREIARADDLHISPFREDGKTYGTPTWIWSVAVDDDLYVRGYNGQKSRWYQAAIKQKAGRITAAGMTKEVAFEPVTGLLNDRNLAMVLIGFAWIVTVSTFNVFVQSIVAGWVKARAIGVYMLIFQGALAVGSLLWGALASQFTVTAAFGIAIIGLILTSAGVFWWPLRTEKPLNVEYSFHWPQADVLPDIHHERGPVLVSLAYEVEPKNQQAFLEAIQKLKNMRLRDGAIRWGIFRDTENANRFIENFIVQSWGEHLRQHARPTFTDKELEDEVFKFNKGGKPPVTTHYIAEGYS